MSIKATILKTLALAKAGGEDCVLVVQLKTEVGVLMRMRLGDSDFARAVQELVEGKFCAFGEEAFSKDKTLTITKAGEKAAGRF